MFCFFAHQLFFIFPQICEFIRSQRRDEPKYTFRCSFVATHLRQPTDGFAIYCRKHKLKRSYFICISCYFFLFLSSFVLKKKKQNNANYVEIDQIYSLTSQENLENYNSSPIYQNTAENSKVPFKIQDTTPIYSNTNSDKYRQEAQGMTFGETLAHNLRHNSGRTETNQEGIVAVCLGKKI